MEHINLVETFSEFKEFKNIDRETMMHIIEEIFRHMLIKRFGTDENFDIIVNIDKGDLEIWRNREIVEDDNIEDDNLEIALSEAIKIEPDFEVGEEVSEEMKLMDFGAFAELEPGLTTLLHSSELSWTKKNISAKKMFKLGDEISCVITEIDKDKRRVAISHRLTQENPFEAFEKKYPVGSIVEGEIISKNEYSLFVKVENLEVDAFLHCNDLTYSNNGEEELTKYKKGEKIKVKVLEIKTNDQKIRVGYRQTQPDPFDWFKDKSKNQTKNV